MTTYKLSFVPEDPKIYSILNLSTDYFKVPLGLISK